MPRRTSEVLFQAQVDRLQMRNRKPGEISPRTSEQSVYAYLHRVAWSGSSAALANATKYATVLGFLTQEEQLALYERADELKSYGR